MRPACTNHPDRNAAAHGLCSACYMRQRRAEKRARYQARYDANIAAGIKGQTTAPRDVAPTGAGVLALMRVWDGDLERRFRTKIDVSAGPDDCHLWLGGINGGGYGVLSVGGHFVLAHRLAHALATGDATTPVVMHKCDNPTCVNPAHLKSGTHLENVQDMRAKGRDVKPTGDHLRDRKRHPRARPVQTPFGEFPSASLAAEALGLHVRAVSRYCACGEIDGGNGYYRADDDPAKPGWAYLPQA